LRSNPLAPFPSYGRKWKQPLLSVGRRTPTVAEQEMEEEREGGEEEEG